MVTLYVDDDKQRVAVMSEGDGSMLPVCMMMIAASPGRSPTIAREYAKLFAAAPELLEACRAVVKTHPRFIEGKGVKYGSVVQVDLPGKVWDELLAAIAKASKVRSRTQEAKYEPM